MTQAQLDLLLRTSALELENAALYRLDKFGYLKQRPDLVPNLAGLVAARDGLRTAVFEARQRVLAEAGLS